MKKNRGNTTNGQTRRDFVGSSALALTALLAPSGLVEAHENSGEPGRPQAGAEPNHFAFGKTYNSAETKQLLLPSQPTRKPNLAAPTGIPFWWDSSANKLVNATKVQFDTQLKPADYQLAATLLSFRASQKDLGDVWGHLSNNAQLNLNPASVSSEGDILQWIVMTGINLTQAVFNQKDSQSATLAQNQNNKPTDSLRPAEAVVFKKGICQLQITLSAQKKNTIWDKLLAAVKSFTGSSIFGMLPIPKLYETAIQSVTASLNQLQTQSHLTKVLDGLSYNYKLYEGQNSNADLTFRSGKWVILDAGFAAEHMGSDHNLKDLYLDVPGLLYQLKDANNQVVDTTYVVADFELSPSTPAKPS